MNREKCESLTCRIAELPEDWPDATQILIEKDGQETFYCKAHHFNLEALELNGLQLKRNLRIKTQEAA